MQFTLQSLGNTKSILLPQSRISFGGGTNYYLIIWKSDNDGNNVKGSGTVSN